MITSKYGIGQQVRHRLLGYLGVIIDIDAKYSLDEPTDTNELASNINLRNAPWYHVVMEDDQGKTIHTYLAEAQLDIEQLKNHPDQSELDELAESIRYQYQESRHKN